MITFSSSIESVMQIIANFADILKSGQIDTLIIKAGLAEKLTRWIANPFYRWSDYRFIRKLGANPKAGSTFYIVKSMTSFFQIKLLKDA